MKTTSFYLTMTDKPITKKKILFISSNLFCAGGIEKYSRDMIKGLANLDYTVQVVSRNDTQNQFKDILLSCCGRISRFGFLRKVLFSVISLWKILCFRPNLIIYGHINFAPLCCLASKLFKTKNVILTYGVETWEIAGALKMKALKQADAIVTISQHTKSRIIEQNPVLAEKIFILSPAVDSSKFFPKRKPQYLLERHRLKESEKIIFTLSRLDKTEGFKGHYNILEIMPKVIRTVKDVKYLIAGSGDDLENLKKVTRQNSLEDSVIFTGHIPDAELTDYYNLCDVFAMPSRQEGFGIVFVEAAMCGKPVIAGNKDGSVDAVLNGDIGVLVDPDSKEEIGKAIIDVLEKKIPSRFLEANYLREKATEAYGLDAFNDRLTNLLNYIRMDKQ